MFHRNGFFQRYIYIRFYLFHIRTCLYVPQEWFFIRIYTSPRGCKREGKRTGERHRCDVSASVMSTMSLSYLLPIYIYIYIYIPTHSSWRQAVQHCRNKLPAVERATRTPRAACGLRAQGLVSVVSKQETKTLPPATQCQQPACANAEQQRTTKLNPR